VNSKWRNGLIASGLFLAGLMLGGIATYYLSTHFLSRFHLWAANLSHVVEIRDTVKILERLQEDNTKKAKEMLESRLDGYLLFYSSGFHGPEEGWKDTLPVLKLAAHYRAKYPRATDQPEIDKGVAKALALADKER
jgi:hypothetical protein